MEKGKFFLLMVLLLSVVACRGNEMNENYTTVLSEKIDLYESLKWLSDKKIYFGHKSVGENIIDGIKEILDQYTQIDIRILETTLDSDFGSPVFAHSSVGRNNDPISKIDAFSGYLKKGINEKVDIAFFKLCYVDFNTLTNIEDVFRRYRNTMTELKNEYPEITFLHLTVPLVTHETGIKTAIKKIVGRPLWGYDDNLVRERYNEMIRREYSGREPLFDIAQVESTHSDGKREFYHKDN